MLNVQHSVLDVTDKLCFDDRVDHWCQLPYPGHPEGCPNHGEKSHCPPSSPVAHDFFDLNKRHWFLITEFDFASYIQIMQIRHPEWSERRLRCVLYWQNQVRTIQRQQITTFRQYHPNTVFTQLPEAMHLNILLTLRHLKIDFETKPKKKVLKIALVGCPNPDFLPKLEPCLV